MSDKSIEYELGFMVIEIALLYENQEKISLCSFIEIIP